MYGFCPSCNFLFISKLVSVQNAWHVHYVGNGTLPCEVCGYPKALILQGTFNYKDYLPQFVSGPPFTESIFEQLRIITEEARKNNYTDKEIIEKAKTINPALVPLLEGLLIRFGPLIVLLSFVLDVGRAITDYTKEDKPSTENVTINNYYPSSPPVAKTDSVQNNKPSPKKKRKRKK